MFSLFNSVIFVNERRNQIGIDQRFIQWDFDIVVMCLLYVTHLLAALWDPGLQYCCHNHNARCDRITLKAKIPLSGPQLCHNYHYVTTVLHIKSHYSGTFVATNDYLGINITVTRKNIAGRFDCAVFAVATGPQN